MEVIHTDVAGPFDEAIDGSRYWVTHLDDYTQWAEVDTISHKSEVFRSTRHFLERHGRPERVTRCIIQGRGGEYTSTEYKDWAYDKAIDLQYSDTEQHEANGCAEALNKAIEEKLQPTLLSAGLSSNYWAPVVKHYIMEVRNLSPCSRHEVTPYEKFRGEQPDIFHIRALGSKVYVLKTERKRQKVVGTKAFTGRLLGFKGHFNYLVAPDGDSGKPEWRTNVVVRERRPHTGPEMLSPIEDCTTDTNNTIQPVEPGGLPFVAPPDSIVGSDKAAAANAADATAKKIALAEEAREALERIGQGNGDEDNESERPEVPSRPSTPTELGRTTTGRPRRNKPNTLYPDEEWTAIALAHQPAIKQPDSFDNRHFTLLCYTLMLASLSTEPFEPKTVDEAKTSGHWSRWEPAMDEEVKSLRLNKTWRLKKRSSINGKRVLRGKWVFTLKRNADGSIAKYKARWVVRGFEQDDDNTSETFASTVKPMSYKALFAIAAAKDYHIHQMDVKTAFLYGDILDEVYVEQPTGFEAEPDAKGLDADASQDNDKEWICELLKALYGLKQSPRIWYNLLTQFLESLGYKPISADVSVFYKGATFIAVYVDDLLIVSPDMDEIDALKRALSTRFTMTDLGPCHYYLGMTVRRDRANRTIYLGQQAYIEKFLKTHNLWDCKPAAVPMDPGAKLKKPDPGYVASLVFRQRYQKAVGSLMYAMLGTRPDIAYAVSVVSRFASNPDQTHWTAVERIMRYLRGTLDYELVYTGHLASLLGYTDADWAGDSETRRSTSGYVFNLGSGTISWSSKLQATVSLSTCEAEYIGQTQATKEAMWLRLLLKDLGHTQLDATVIFGDNQGAIASSKNPQFHGRMKHVDIQHHYVRERTEDGDVDMQWTKTSKMIADGLTKPLNKELFARFRMALGLEARG